MDGLVLRTEDHRYFLHGEPVVNVTRALDRLCDFSRVSAETLRYAQELGTAVHRACELDDTGDLDEETVADVVRPRLAAYRKFRAENKPQWDGIEELVHHHVHKYAGTLDRRGFMCGGAAICDLKSGVEIPVVALQTSAYLEAHCAHAGESSRGWKRFALYLKDDGNYRLKEITTQHTTDFRDFLSALNTWRWLERNNLIPKEA